MAHQKISLISIAVSESSENKIFILIQVSPAKNYTKLWFVCIFVRLDVLVQWYIILVKLISHSQPLTFTSKYHILIKQSCKYTEKCVFFCISVLSLNPSWGSIIWVISPRFTIFYLICSSSIQWIMGCSIKDPNQKPKLCSTFQSEKRGKRLPFISDIWFC